LKQRKNGAADGTPSEKTNVMRVLEQRGIGYGSFFYGTSEPVSGTEVAAMLGQDPDRVFKTLVTVGHSGEHYVFMVPVAEELDLKKAASAVGEKSIAMIRSKELLPLTGYVHGGCSPIGMKKLFTTVIDETAELFDSILFSAGKIGAQVDVAPEDLGTVIPLIYADITVR
jgi:Cys-tRNA(Pro)/Cys-tRNA(Cys) deacylase